MKDLPIYNIIIETNSGDFVRLGFTNKQMSETEFNRIKAGGIYAGSWIKRIELSEDALKPSTTKHSKQSQQV